MGKRKKDSNSLGRALIKDRFSGRHLGSESSLLHTADVADGYDWGRLNLQSVTEENSFQEFLSTAELAGTEFQAEKLNITFVNPASQIGLLSASERKRISDVQEQNKQFLQIPRRPNWDAETTPEELHSGERDAFLDWRRKLALFQEENAKNGLILTPYEKNIEFWRQLWRVVEKSDIVVQIVDGRNPLLFRCEDLERYVQEVSAKQGHGKTNFILINKADFLTERQRELWAEFFDKEKIRIAFFSAIQSDAEEIKEEEITSVHESDDETGESDYESADTDVDTDNKEKENAVESTVNESVDCKSLPKDMNSLSLGESVVVKPTGAGVTEGETAVKSDKKVVTEEVEDGKIVSVKTDDEKANIESGQVIKNSSKVLTRKELIDLFKNLRVNDSNTSMENSVRTVGLVGYPNVGKSSTINCVMEVKKVSVSATPGKTKHFQTLFVDQELLLCDCPGLVMPSFVSTQAEMVLWGILPVDRLKDHVPSVSMLATLIPRHALEDRYGIMLPSPPEGEDPDRPPTSEELLNAYGYIRGFMTQRGLPDNPRTARYVLKDFINGKLLYAKAPPGHSQEDFHTFDVSQKKNKPHGASSSSGTTQLPPQLRRIRGKVAAEELDKVFFQQAASGVHSKGRKGGGIGGATPGGSGEGSGGNAGKPWKKHNNKNKKEKLRRVYSYLDQ